MSTTWDWSPVLGPQGAIQQYLQNLQFQKQIGGMMGQENIPGVPAMNASVNLPKQATMPGFGGGQFGVGDGGVPAQVPGNQVTARMPGGYHPMIGGGNISVGGGQIDASTSAIAPQTTYTGPVGQALGDERSAALMPFLQAMGPRSLPMLLQTTQDALQHKQDIADKRITPMSGQDAAKWNLRQGGSYGTDAAGNPVTLQASDLPSQARVDQENTQKHVTPITNPNDPHLPPMNTRKPGEQFGIDAAGNLVVTNPGSGKSQVELQQDIADRPPQFVPFGATGYMQGGKYVSLPGSAGGGVTADPSSPSAPVQLGLSSGAYNLLTGNTSALGTRDKAAANKELDGFFARSGLDPSLVKPQVQAFGSAVNMNTLKANTMDTLAKEVVGTVQNYGPVIDKLTGGGNLRLGNKGWELLGSATNDPTAQQALVYLNQMRADLAGFNAASGGKIGMHGQTATDNADFAKADEVIKNGLSSGGAKAIAQAIEATRQKNVAVAQQQVQEAQRGIWNALGIGPRYDATHPASAQGGGGDSQLPQAARSQLKENTNTTFANGQIWTLKNGTPQRVK